MPVCGVRRRNLSSHAYVRYRPSGDHLSEIEGDVQYGAVKSASFRSGPPRAGIIKIPLFAAANRTNAMFRPSGDHAGNSHLAPLWVRRSTFSAPTTFTYRSNDSSPRCQLGSLPSVPVQENAIWLPSGENAGAISATGSVVRGGRGCHPARLWPNLGRSAHIGMCRKSAAQVEGSTTQVSSVSRPL
jgi:hypothetical protein